MTSIDYELQKLLAARAGLARTLEENPVFQALQHVEKAIAVLERSASAASKPPEASGNVIYGVVSAQQRDVIADAVIDHFIQTGNAPATIKELCEALQARGVALPAHAVSSIGGIVSKRGMFMRCPGRPGYWRLTDEFLRNSMPRAA